MVRWYSSHPKLRLFTLWKSLSRRIMILPRSIESTRELGIRWFYNWNCIIRAIKISLMKFFAIISISHVQINSLFKKKPKRRLRQLIYLTLLVSLKPKSSCSILILRKLCMIFPWSHSLTNNSSMLPK